MLHHMVRDFLGQSFVSSSDEHDVFEGAGHFPKFVQIDVIKVGIRFDTQREDLTGNAYRVKPSLNINTTADALKEFPV